MTANRTATQTELTFNIASNVIVNADIKSDAAIAQSKLNMNAATSRADATGISQADLGLASFDSGDFTVTNGWVELSSSGIDFADLPQLDQYEAYGRTDSGTGDVSAVTFSDIISQGGAVVDADFTTELDAASDPGEALIKASAGVYKVTNVTKTGETNSIIKTDTSGVTDLQGLKIDGNLALDSSASTLNITTPVE